MIPPPRLRAPNTTMVCGIQCGPFDSAGCASLKFEGKNHCLFCGEGKERGISPAGVAERPRRGWVQPGEFARAQVKYREVFPFDLDLSAVGEKDATVMLRSVESDHLTRRDERDPDFVSRRSDFLRQPSRSIGKFEVVQLKARGFRMSSALPARRAWLTGCRVRSPTRARTIQLSGRIRRS
jgi:hypothetical protein